MFGQITLFVLLVVFICSVYICYDLYRHGDADGRNILWRSSDDSIGVMLEFFGISMISAMAISGVILTIVMLVRGISPFCC